MPDMHQSLQQVNAAFSAAKVRSLSPGSFANAADLADALDSLPGVSLTAAAKAFVRSWPTGLQAAVQAAIHTNLSRPEKTRVPIVMSWTPGYDFEVRIWDIRNTQATHGELTIHLTSRYPGDPHPIGVPPISIDL